MGIGSGKISISRWRGKYHAKASSSPNTPPEAPMHRLAAWVAFCTISSVAAAVSTQHK